MQIFNNINDLVSKILKLKDLNHKIMKKSIKKVKKRLEMKN